MQSPLVTIAPHCPSHPLHSTCESKRQSLRAMLETVQPGLQAQGLSTSPAVGASHLSA